MSCWCGHCPGRHHCYPYPPSPPPEEYYPPDWRPRRAGDIDEVSDQLRELTTQVAQLRRELNDLRGS